MRHERGAMITDYQLHKLAEKYGLEIEVGRVRAGQVVLRPGLRLPVLVEWHDSSAVIEQRIRAVAYVLRKGWEVLDRSNAEDAAQEANPSHVGKSFRKG